MKTGATGETTAKPIGFAAGATECTECPAETATEGRSVQRRTENHHGSVNSVSSVSSVRSVSSVNSVYSVDSVSSARSVHSVVGDTIPPGLEGWKTSLFKFTRALKFDCGLAGADMADIRPHVEHWYREAVGVLEGVAFSDVWGEVVTSWERARHSAYSDPLGVALATARQQADLPPVPDLVGYDEQDVALAYRLLFWLTLNDHSFFVSCRALAERLEVDHTKAWRILRMFEADGIIVCLKRGRTPKASRYRWNGSVTRSTTE